MTNLQTFIVIFEVLAIGMTEGCAGNIPAMDDAGYVDAMPTQEEDANADAANLGDAGEAPDASPADAGVEFQANQVYIDNGTFDPIDTTPGEQITWYQEGVGGIALFHWNWNSAPNQCASTSECVEPIRYHVTTPSNCQILEAHAIVQSSNTTVRRRFVHDSTVLDEQAEGETLSFEPFYPTGSTYFEYLPDPCDNDDLACVLLVYGQYLIIECPID